MLSRLSASYTNWISTNLRWIPTSEKELEISETKIFSYLTSKFKTYAVDVTEGEKKKKRCGKEEERKIWTIEMEDPKTNRPPIVLVMLIESLNYNVIDKLNIIDNNIKIVCSSSPE